MVHRRVLFIILYFMGVAILPQNVETNLRKKLCNKNDAPAEMHGKWQKYPQTQRKGQSFIPPTTSSLAIASAIFDETSGKNICGRFWQINARTRQERSEFGWNWDCSSIEKLAANGEVQTHEEAIGYVHDFDFFVTVQILEDTFAVLSLGKFWEHHGYSYESTSGQKATLHQTWQKYNAKRKIMHQSL